MKKIFLFPGQGSQFVGMGNDIINNFSIAKSIFEVNIVKRRFLLILAMIYFPKQ